MASFKRNRVLNTSLVLREIWTHREISRVQIAKNLDLDKSTVTSIVAGLLEKGVVEETAIGKAGPQGGRKPVLLKLNGSKGSVIGIEMKPDGYTAVAADLSGRIIDTWVGDFEICESNLATSFLDIVAELRGKVPGDAPIQGIGLGVPGVVNTGKNIINYSMPLGITKPWDFKSNVADQCDLPVYIENDANACAWAELAFHRTKKLKNFVFVLLEFRDTTRLRGLHERTALGLGIVIDGRVYHGRNYSAGEFRSILRGPNNKGQFSLSDEESLRIADDPHLLDRVIDELAKNVSLLATTLNLDEVYLGGDIERYGELMVPVFEKKIQDNWPYPDKVHCKVKFSSLGRKAVAYGAAGLVLHRLFAELGAMGRIARSLPAFPPGVKEQFNTGTVGFQTTP